VIPDSVNGQLVDFLAEADRLHASRIAGLYVVGSLALGDFEERRSSIDVVAVSETPLAPAELGGLARFHKLLDRRRRPPWVGYTTWDRLASGPGDAAMACFRGGAGVDPSRFATPMTWEQVRSTAVVMRGPDYPVVWHDELILRKWFFDQLALEQRQSDRPTKLWLRSATSHTVLRLTQLFLGLRRGTVVAQRAAAEAMIENLADQFRRVVEDSLSYRAGVTTSLYWGFLERRQDVRALMTELVARSAPQAGA
jgi:hypothetical protein